MLVFYLMIKNMVNYSLLFRCYNLGSDFTMFHYEVSHLNVILGKNGYLSKVDFSVRNFVSVDILRYSFIATMDWFFEPLDV